ncbi:MAG TPA: cell division protein SepF [Aldersonia sp.]
MSTLHKVKAYFGMVPLEDYDDDYLEEPGAPRRRPPAPDGYADDYADPGHSAPGYEYADNYRDDYDRRPRIEPISARSARPSTPPPARGTTRGALAVDAGLDRRRVDERHSRVDERHSPVFDEGGPLSKITTLRPRDYSEARTIGERFRDGTPVIMDLVDMSNADAKRLVDFAAGLAFALRGSFDKVATKVFLLSPADIDVSAEERRRIAETGFYNQQ